MATQVIRKSDEQIQADVLAELKWDTRLSPAEVGVKVKHGVVTLVGEIDSWGKYMAAQDAAHRVSGVLDIANDLVVRIPGGAQHSDTDIAIAVRNALEWDVFVPDRKIRSTVRDGVVTLEGDVELAAERADAERAVRNLIGVRRVENHIVVHAAAGVGDVRKAIISALARHASQEAAALDIQVQDGVVTLNGRVDSWAEREAIAAAAMSTRGVKRIDNKLRVDV
jgi:osmotically-inducible protein OsmY